MLRFPAQRKWLRSALVAAALVAAAAGTALATPASGILAGPILARGDFPDRVDVKFKIQTPHGIHVSQASGAGEVVMQQIVFAPGGQTGWHTHPGPAVAVVQSGSLELQWQEHGACVSATYEAGEAFVDHGQGRVHRAVNTSASAEATVYVTYFDVPVGGSPRLDAPVPEAC